MISWQVEYACIFSSPLGRDIPSFAWLLSVMRSPPHLFSFGVGRPIQHNVEYGSTDYTVMQVHMAHIHI